MLKALISAPPDFTLQGDLSNLLSPGDFAAVVGRLSSQVLEASTIMEKAASFVKAYTSLTHTDVAKIQGELEARLVMHVHNKRSGTRKSSPSLLHIAESFYEGLTELQKAVGKKLPEWTLLTNIKSKPPSTTARGIDQISIDGNVADATMEVNGFKVGVEVKRKGKKGETTAIYTIADMSCQNVRLKLAKRTQRRRG